MNAVERLGRYITRGVYTVSGPFHPFGGAVDIIVVEQPDGSFKSSPWYVRFGKFQGVLKAREKVVNVSVNEVEADFHMYLDRRGEAFFLREVEGDEEESVLYPLSSSDETDEQSQKNRRPAKTKSCNYDAYQLNSGDQLDGTNGSILARTNSRRSRILGLVFGRGSFKEDSCREGDDGAGKARTSLERAEIAADLLEVRWSTNLDPTKPRKDNDSRFSASDALEGNGHNMPAIDDKSRKESSLHDAIETNADRCMLAEETVSCNVETVNDLQSGFMSLECSAEEPSVEMSTLGSMDQVAETSTMDESVLDEKCGVVSGLSRDINELSSQNADPDVKAKGVISVVSAPEAKISDVPEACPGENVGDKQPCDEKDASLPDHATSEEESESRAQSFIYCETSESSIMRLNGYTEQTHGTLYLASGGPREAHFSAKTLHLTAEPLPEDMLKQQPEDIELETERIDASYSFSNQTNPSSCMHIHDKVNLEVPMIVSKSDAQMVGAESADPMLGSAEELESMSTGTILNFSNTGQKTQDVKNNGKEIIRNEPQSAVDSFGDSEHFYGSCGPTKTAIIPALESSEEEQFIFSDLDELKPSRTQCESNFLGEKDEKNDPSFCLERNEEMDGSLDTSDVSCSSPDQFVQESRLADLETPKEYSKITSSPIGIPKVHSVTDAEVSRLVESLPNMRSRFDNMDANDLHFPLSHSLDSISKSLEETLCRTNESECVKLDTGNEIQSAKEHSNIEGDSSKVIVASGGSWRIWPFSFKRSRSRKIPQHALNDTRSSDSENVSDCNLHTDKDYSVINPKVTKKMVRANTPTSEQLASLNLKEGRNVVTFTFSTAMLGKQQVDARIYLWKWNTHIVISDVDGTITRSDVLGQFMPMVGVDWSQMGVAHLFCAIKENGYQLLFLSARAISQAYHTRQFLVNLKQDGKALPDGPIVISPDGVFPSLFREVIRRAPHEFKIACLEDIRALFPSDCNPFYAGFGNRDTDEISYLKVGIPKGKIFIINPKGEVAVNRRVDTKSYTSLHALVHDMFPPMTSFEQEDFNSWNYWRLPPPVIDI
ncbi:PREDICTED: phosphatidate phosphatase PAH2-like isoform X2 [Populus euphratica]|uniref:Phosphatidate phosphatase PAH2-like isoform X2 n=1 Tax=Populus euphratica TaxID=75702 RepID=A0AAJ6UIT1_POPEU|nr:PREDICTED: phosphatidate phosphatase PAH2-like isoform X2 [Populus euphratica]